MNAVLIGIRITGYGSEYDVKITCPSCSKEFENKFSLSRLILKTLGASPVQPNTNLFAFRLPHSGAEILFRLLTGKDESEISKILESKKKIGQIESTVTTRLLQSVYSVNGETDKQKVSQFVVNMRALDARALRKYIDEIEPGIDMTQKITCPYCDIESEVKMPLGVTFLWPDLGK